jgi:hypothetical protein
MRRVTDFVSYASRALARSPTTAVLRWNANGCDLRSGVPPAASVASLSSLGRGGAPLRLRTPAPCSPHRDPRKARRGLPRGARGVCGYTDALLAIPVHEADPREPHRRNRFLFGMDGVSLYCFSRERAPRRYIEVGSGELDPVCGPCPPRRQHRHGDRLRRPPSPSRDRRDLRPHRPRAPRDH